MFKLTPDSYDRSSKAEARERLFSGLVSSKVLVALPGPEALCIRRMIELGIVTPSTQQVWIENDPRRSAQMRATAAAMGLTPVIIEDDIRRWQPTVPFDLLNLDTEEGFTPLLGFWFEKQAGAFLAPTGAALLITLTGHSRNGVVSAFSKWWASYLQREETLRRVHDEGIMPRFNHHNPTLAGQMLLLACSLRNHYLNFDVSEEYSDGFGMLSFRAIAHPRNSDPVLPSFTSIYHAFEASYGSAKETYVPGLSRETVDDGAGRKIFTMPTRYRSANYRERGLMAVATRHRNAVCRMREEVEKLAREIERMEAKALAAEQKVAREQSERRGLKSD